MLPAVTTCLESHCISAVVSKYKEKLQSLVMQSLCNVLPGVGGSLVTEIDKKICSGNCKKQCRYTAEKSCHSISLHHNSPLSSGGKSLPCNDISELIFLSNCSLHKYQTWQMYVSTRGYEAEIRLIW